jgi:hypothetical protein
MDPDSSEEVCSPDEGMDLIRERYPLAVHLGVWERVSEEPE